MSLRILAPSAGLLLIGALSSTSFLNSDKLSNALSGFGNLFSSSKNISKKSEVKEEQKVAVKVEEKVEATPTVSENVDIVEPVVIKNVLAEVPLSEPLKGPEVVLKGPEGKSPKPSNSSNGSAGWCVNPFRAYFVTDIKTCTSW